MLRWLRKKIKKIQSDEDTAKDIKYLEYLVENFLSSKKRQDMLTGERYYLGKHDILFSKKEVIGEGGRLEEVQNLPNNKRIDNQYEKLVEQKVNYLLGKPLAFETCNLIYQKELEKVLNNDFNLKLKRLCQDMLNGGIAWLYVFYNEVGELDFKNFKSYEILPLWKDEEHTVLEAFIRIYTIHEWNGSRLEDKEVVDVHTLAGIDRYKYHYGSLKFENHFNYFEINENGYNWDTLPIIPFKYNKNETPLINKVKSLQDGINKAISNLENNLDETPRNCILILKNYDGQNLGEFRHNLSKYGAVKVRGEGSVEKLTTEFDAQNYKEIIKIFKDALIENGRGFNAKDERMANNPNEMNIQSMYADIELDSLGMENEIKKGLETLFYFINLCSQHKKIGNFENEKVEIIFNKDILMNESQTIVNCKNSIGIISDETIISQHPWVKNNLDEIEKIKKQKSEEIVSYGGFDE